MRKYLLVNKRQILQRYEKSIYAASNLDAAVNILSNTAEELGFAGASCVFWPRPKRPTEELPPPAIRLSGSNLSSGGLVWNANYIKDELYKSDFVYRALYGTNLADEHYITSGVGAIGVLGFDEAQYARPREWAVSLTYRF